MQSSPEIAVLDELIHQATAKVDELRGVQQQAARDLDVQERLLAMLQATRAEKRRKSRQKLQSPKEPPAGETNGRSLSLADHIAFVLAEVGSTMRGTEVAKALADQGITTGSKHGLLPMVLATLRSRRTRFRKVSRGRYTLRKSEKEQQVNDKT